MNRNRQNPTVLKLLALVLTIVLFAGLASGCDIAELLSKGTDIIDQFANASTDAALPPNASNTPGLPDIFQNPTNPKPTAPAAANPAPVVTVPVATEPSAPEFVFDPDDIRYGIVLPDSVTLYKGPSQTEKQTGSLNYGDRVQILGTDKGWAYTANGWCKADSFYIEGDKGEYAVGSSTVTGTDVNLRSGPGLDYEVLKRHNTGDQLDILEEFLSGDLWWGYTGKGWICMDYVYVNGAISDNYGIGIITGDVVNVRKGPGTNYETVGSVKQGQQVEVYNYFTVKNIKWACTNKGWICMDYIRYTPAT